MYENLVSFKYTDATIYKRNWNNVTLHARGIVFDTETGKEESYRIVQLWASALNVRCVQQIEIENFAELLDHVKTLPNTKKV